MSLTKFNGETNNIQGLADKPTQSASQLKALFDKIGTDIKTYLNGTLTTEIDTALAGKADTTQTDVKIDSEFQYQDVEINISSSLSEGTGFTTYNLPTGYALFTASIVYSNVPGVASIFLIDTEEKEIFVHTFANGGHQGKVKARIVFKKTT